VLTPDYAKMYAETRRLADLLGKASEARITTSLGTNISMSITGRNAFCNCVGGPLGPGSAKHRMTLPCGEATISPVEGTVEGVLVVDHAIDGVGLLSSVVTVVAKEGKVVSVEGGREAAWLLGILSKTDAQASHFAELAIGTNPNSRLIGNVAEDKKRRGSMHMAIGDNHLLGGNITSSVHLDMIVLKPNIWLDGKEIARQGEFQFD
jgi:leucyl aminopeptidase (aminopeptidase T)